MKVLITGANGFLAANTTRELLRRGHIVRAMMRPGADERSLRGVECERFYGNILQKSDVDQAMTGCDAVIHAAADTSQNKRSANDYFPVNVLATQYVLSSAIHHGIGRLVFVSTANTIGYGTREHPGTEALPMAWPLTTSGYAVSKAQAEKLILEAYTEGKLETVVVNPTFMIGPHDAKPSSGRIFLMYLGKPVMAMPAGLKNYICVTDAAAGVVSALEKGRAGEKYLLAGENLSFLEFFQKVDRITGKKPMKIVVPPKMLIALGCIAGWLAPKGSLTSGNAEILSAGHYYSAAKAVRELDLPRTPVETGIRQAMDWFREAGMIR